MVWEHLHPHKNWFQNHIKYENQCLTLYRITMMCRKEVWRRKPLFVFPLLNMQSVEYFNENIPVFWDFVYYLSFIFAKELYKNITFSPWSFSKHMCVLCAIYMFDFWTPSEWVISSVLSLTALPCSNSVAQEIDSMSLGGIEKNLWTHKRWEASNQERAWKQGTQENFC